MSLGVNLSSRELLTAYQAVLNGEEANWTIFTYEKASNDLRVQASGSGGLDELSEEFSDGRCAETAGVRLHVVYDWEQDTIRFRARQGSQCASNAALLQVATLTCADRAEQVCSNQLVRRRRPRGKERFATVAIARRRN